MSPSVDEAVSSETPPLAQTAPFNASHAKLFSLAGKTVAVTGGGRGLGLHMAIAVVEAGGSVACMDILEEPAAAEWEQIQKAAVVNGSHVSYHRCDVTSEQAVGEIMEAVAAEAETRGTPFWGTIAAAGVQQQCLAMDYSSADFDRIMRINVTGVFNTCKYAGRILHRNNRPGSIVIIASISGHIANRGLTCTAYNTSKAAVHQMCRSIAQEWGQYGIRINTISPGYIRTAMTDQLISNEPDVEETWMASALLNRFGTPDDLKSPAVFLLSEGAAFIHGSDIRVDGGSTASI